VCGVLGLSKGSFRYLKLILKSLNPLPNLRGTVLTLIVRVNIAVP
jgi:hypothetical protein